MTEMDIIDRASIDDLLASVDGNSEFFAELLETYFDDALAQIGAMQAAAAAENADGVRRAAHSLKSNSATFGALVLSAMCRDLEMMGKAGVLDGAPEAIAAIAAEHERVRVALDAIRDGR